ncbi:MAG: hypothetical protein LBI82_07465 [Dysgonamonadaceae bacterium]|jgi:DNA-directed RNA polymerase specialized sigma54-like protein|nr:hypothetical protein [Dysgonamonadaceae bacterium]
MSEDNKDLGFEYDDDEAVAFIQNFLPQELKEKFSSDELNYIIDLIYEFYEDKGFLEETDDEVEVEIDEEELITFVIKQAQKDKVGKFSPEEITFIVQGELAYCESLDIFD